MLELVKVIQDGPRFRSLYANGTSFVVTGKLGATDSIRDVLLDGIQVFKISDHNTNSIKIGFYSSRGDFLSTPARIIADRSSINVV